jgi:hypothetical protein
MSRLKQIFLLNLILLNLIYVSVVFAQQQDPKDLEQKEIAQREVRKGSFTILPNLPTLTAQSETVPSSLQVMGLFFSKTTMTNVFADNPLFANGPLNGRLYGANQSTTYRPNEDTQAFTEMRYISYLSYSPAPTNGKLTLRAAFEIDGAFGDLSNTQQGNVGFGFNGDTVNIQTKRLSAKWQINSNWNLVAGLQPLADNALDPAAAMPTDIMYGGTKMIFWGSDVAGFSLYGKTLDKKLSSRLGYYTLYSNHLNKPDDVTLMMLDVEWSMFDPIKAGLHIWYLKDRSQGKGTAFGVGPTSRLADYHGAVKVDSKGQAADIDALWLALDGSYSRWMSGSPLSLSGFVAMNWADMRFKTKNLNAMADPTAPRNASLIGIMAQGDALYRWGKNDGDHISMSAIYASGDQNPNDTTLSSVLTGNQYGIPGSLYITHRSLLLFPDPRSVNRQLSVVYDPSNLGYGVLGGSFNVAKDLIPDLLNLKLGTAMASSAAKPVDSSGKFVGWELNAEMIYRPAPFFFLGLHAGWLRYGQFLENNTDRVPGSLPWVAYFSMTWLHF